MDKNLKIAVVALLIICLVVVGVFVVKSFNSEQKNLNTSVNNEGIASAGSEKDNPVDKTDNSNEPEGNGTDDSLNNTNDNTSDDNKNTANNEAGNDSSNTSGSNTEASNVSENSGSDESENADESNQGSAEDESDEVEEDVNSDENSDDNTDNNGKETNDGNTDEGKEENEGSNSGKIGRLEGIIGGPINGKDVIKGEKYEGVQRGVIKTSAYNPLFKNVEGNYIITSEEELTIFKILVMDERLSEEFLNIEFDKYTLVIRAIESKTSSLIFQVNGLIIGEENIAIDSITESQGMATQDMARFYPYVLIEKDKLAKDTYEGWIKPSEVEQTNVR